MPRAATSRSRSSNGTRSRPSSCSSVRAWTLAVLEVGMGGRLDAVNILDADAAAVVSVGIDHREYLGDTIEAIGAEKAGIFRAGKPAIFGGRMRCRRASPRSGEDRRAPAAHRHGFRFRRAGGRLGLCRFQARGGASCPCRRLLAQASSASAAVAVAMLEATEPKLLVPDAAVSAGLAAAQSAGAVPGHRRRSGVDSGRRPQRAGCAVARREPCGAPGPQPHDRRLRDPGRQGRRVDRGRAGDAGRALDRRRSRGPRALASSDLARRIERASGGSVLATADVATGWRLRGPRPSPATVSSCSVLSDRRTRAYLAGCRSLTGTGATISGHGSARARTS